MNTVLASGTWTIVSPPVCAGPSSTKVTARSPTLSSIRPANVCDGPRKVMLEKSNGPKACSTNAARSGGMPGADFNPCSPSGESCPISSALAAEA